MFQFKLQIAGYEKVERFVYLGSTVGKNGVPLKKYNERQFFLEKLNVVWIIPL